MTADEERRVGVIVMERPEPVARLGDLRTRLAAEAMLPDGVGVAERGLEHRAAFRRVREQPVRRAPRRFVGLARHQAEVDTLRVYAVLERRLQDLHPRHAEPLA